MSAVASSPSPSALNAFLRGVERRGAVLAELQCGDAGRGDAALQSAMHAFQAGAHAVPMAEWPSRFWAALLAEPALRQRVKVALPLDATDRLGDLATGPRAALLLRLAAGLDETDAAGALGVGVETYRLALRRALPHHADGRADPQAWQHLRDQVHRRIKSLPPERLARLAEARGAALRGSCAPAPRTPAALPASASRPPWLLPVLWVMLALCAVALAATWWPASSLGADTVRGVRIEPLPPPASPAAVLSEDAAVIGHPDFGLLADPEGEALAGQLPLQAWLLAVEAGTVTPPAPSEDGAATAPTAGGAPAEALSPLESLEDADALSAP